jgi:hypothetical protein
MSEGFTATVKLSTSLRSVIFLVARYSDGAVGQLCLETVSPNSLA